MADLHLPRPALCLPWHSRAACALGFALATSVTAASAQQIVGGTPTSAFAAVGIGVQITPDWVLTAAHVAISAGGTFENGYGSRNVAQLFYAPGSGTFPANDLALMRLVPAATAAPYVVVNDALPPVGDFPAFDATIVSALNHTPRGFAFTTAGRAYATYDDDGSGPLQPVAVNWLVTVDANVYVQGGDSGGGLFLGHVGDTSVLLGLTSAILEYAPGVIEGSAFVQPGAYRSWIDAVMAADLNDSQVVLWQSALAVPEPPAALLAAAGLALLLSRRRRQK